MTRGWLLLIEGRPRQSDAGKVHTLFVMRLTTFMSTVRMKLIRHVLIALCRTNKDICTFITIPKTNSYAHQCVNMMCNKHEENGCRHKSLSCSILCFVDRATLYNLFQMKPNTCTVLLSILPCISNSLHVLSNYGSIIMRTYFIYATLVFFTLYGWLSGLLVKMRLVSS